MLRAEPQPLDDALLRREPLPVRASDKDGRGTVLVIAGAPTTPGAAILAGTAALRMGAGKLQIAVPDAVAVDVAVAVPEAKVVGWPADASGKVRPRRASSVLAPLVAHADAVLVGPGMSGRGRTRRLVAWVAGALSPEATLVLDAIALAAIADADDATRQRLRQRLVLTPNRHELARLAGCEVAAGHLLAPCASVAAAYGAAVTCFDVVTAADGRAWFGGDGGPALGTSGSGDVLAGLVAGAAARGADPARAACWGTVVHARSGLRLSRRIGPLSVLARDLVAEAAAVMGDLDGAG